MNLIVRELEHVVEGLTNRVDCCKSTSHSTDTHTRTHIWTNQNYETARDIFLGRGWGMNMSPIETCLLRMHEREPVAAGEV